MLVIKKGLHFDHSSLFECTNRDLFVLSQVHASKVVRLSTRPWGKTSPIITASEEKPPGEFRERTVMVWNVAVQNIINLSICKEKFSKKKSICKEEKRRKKFDLKGSPWSGVDHCIMGRDVFFSFSELSTVYKKCFYTSWKSNVWTRNNKALNRLWTVNQMFTER